MDFNFDEIINRMAAGTPDVPDKPKIEPVPLPVLPERHKGFETTQSTSSEWSALYGLLNDKINCDATLCLIGQRGCGKTQLGVCLIKSYCRSGKTADYKKAFEIFLRIRETDSETVAVQDFIKPFLLVIDAFEVRGDTPFENRMINHILDKRYDAMKTTIIISNDTRDELVKVLGESIVDRMRESGGIIEMKWKSFRGS